MNSNLDKHASGFGFLSKPPRGFWVQSSTHAFPLLVGPCQRQLRPKPKNKRLRQNRVCDTTLVSQLCKCYAFVDICLRCVYMVVYLSTYLLILRKFNDYVLCSRMDCLMYISNYTSKSLRNCFLIYPLKYIWESILIRDPLVDII